MRLPVQNLPEGYVAEAVNTRFRYGAAEPRKGMQALNWAQLLGAEWPWEWPVIWNTPISMGEPVGIGRFEDPNGTDWILVAAKLDSRVKVFAITANNRAIPVPSSTPIIADSDTDYWFTQAFNKVILHRGRNYEPLELSDISVGFTSITETTLSTDSGTAVEAIPNGPNSLFYRNRLIVPNIEGGSGKLDLLSLSDYLNYTRYLPAFGDLRINQGDADEIVRAVEFNDETIIVFKESSIYQLTVPNGDWDLAVLSSITRQYGLVGQRAVVHSGGDLWFLSQWGITSIAQTEDNKVQGRSIPLSEPMQPIIERINWSAAKTTAVGEYYQDRVYFSVPIDGSTKNNCVLVYDFLNQAWSGYDYWSGAAKVAYFVKSDYLSGEKLFYVDYDGIIGLYEYSEQDTQLGEPSSFKAQVLLTGQPATGDRIRVNGGDWVTADDSAPSNAGTTWGTGTSQQNAADNLYTGYSGSWAHETDSVRVLNFGVEFEDSATPIDIRYEPYSSSEAINIYADAAKSFLPVQIDHWIITRGYHFDQGDRRRAIDAQVYLGTLDSRYKITAIQDGVSEEKVIIDESSQADGSTRSSLDYTTFGKSQWDPSNANNDFKSPYREDYLVQLSDLSAGDYALKLHDDSPDVSLNNYQKWLKRFNVERRGSYFQIKIQGIQGRTQLYSVSMGAVRGKNNNGQIA